MLDQFADYDCPSCGESIQLVIDPAGGRLQQYTEDCPVCCRPNLITVHIDRDGRVSVDVESE